MKGKIETRPYRPEDLPAVREICIATGLGGRLKEHFCDEEIFVKLWLGAYFKLNPSACRVATRDGQIVGYLVGTYDNHFNRKALIVLMPTLFQMIGRWIVGRYKHHPPTTRFLKWLLFRAWKENPKTPTPSSHFHFNIKDGEGEGMPGYRLGRDFINHARELGKPCWHAVVFAGAGRKDRPFYVRMGFEIYDWKPCSLLGEGSELATIVKKIGPEQTSPID